MYDLLIVGAGITAATLVASLKDRLRICVVDCRTHLGGNCFDHASQGTMVHQYGPHIFHCPSPRIVAFLSKYTQWTPYEHTVLAEIFHDGALRHVPFPYSRRTVPVLGRELSQEEVLERFFQHYSRKMWGMPWAQLPASVRGRIPMEPAERPIYYRDDFVALPKLGYTFMLENMFDGVELILGTSPAEWTRIKATAVVYTGRPDQIPVPGQRGVTMGQYAGLHLDHRTLDISFAPDNWPFESVCVHACTMERTWTRKTHFARMTGGHSAITSTETPRQAAADDLMPFYPVELPANRQRYEQLASQIRAYYPHVHLAGRLGSYRYFDMYQAVGQALALAKKLSTQTGTDFCEQRQTA